MKTFKTGDNVIIKSWEQMEKEFGESSYNRYIKCKFGFNEDMRYLCGKKATIKEIWGDKVTLNWLDKEDLKRPFFSFSTDMIELVEDKTEVIKKVEDTFKTSNEFIMITHNGHSTVATHVKDGIAKTSKAMCHPEDDFDFGTGVLLSAERLFPESIEILNKAKGTAEKVEKVKIPSSIRKNDYLTFNGIEYCDLGMATNFTDVYGKPLFTGDIVEVYNSITDDKCESAIAFDDIDNYFVMGYASQKNWVRGCSSSYLYITKVRSYNDINNGYKLDGLSYVKFPKLTI